MKIPEKFECGGRTIIVERVNFMSDRFGEWVPGDGIIRVQKQANEAEWVTLLHEVCHAISDSYGCGVDDERTIEALAQGIAQFLKTKE